MIELLFVEHLSLAPGNLDLIKEINNLWEPVYPYLAKTIHELYGRQDGHIVEIGPFCGVIFALLRQEIGSSFSIAAFPPEMGDFFRQEAVERKVEDKIEIIESDPSLTGVKEDRFDLLIFRGAFFFPSLFSVHFPEIHHVLKPKGMAFIGGGFGKFTPDSMIKEIGKRSRDLNLRMGKIEVDEDQFRRDMEKSPIRGKVQIIPEGGLWMLMRK